jgi:hypothetical protein
MKYTTNSKLLSFVRLTQHKIKVSILRQVRFFPQTHFTEHARIAAPEKFQEKLGISPIPSASVKFTRMRLEQNLWESISVRDWDGFDAALNKFKMCGLPFDEVSYTLLCHGYLISHRHLSSNALLVIEEMKAAEIHPVIIEMNERLVLSLLDFSDFGIRPDSFAWQNMLRLVWMSAARLRRKRAKRISDQLLTLPDSEINQISREDIKMLITSDNQRHSTQDLSP